jgi:predicted metal-dependent HD superfamily phosphohydrolase
MAALAARLRAAFVAVLPSAHAASPSPASEEEAWAELVKRYGARGRHYHTLQHLAHLLAELTPYQAAIGADWPALVLAVFYHDAIYNPRRSDNEEKSAELAAARLPTLGIPPEATQRCVDLILATRHVSHQTLSPDWLTQLFLDADLSILGASPEAYAAYAAHIRREYGWFPDLIYRPGRRKVLLHFLAQPRLFQTPDFAARYEAAARQNLANELQALGG